MPSIPAPLVVIGAMVDGKPNWLIAGHVGIIGHDHVMVSLAKPHYTNKGIRETKKLSINIVTEDFLPLADRAGCVSGAKKDKSGLLECTVTEAGVPTVAASPVVMECSVEDIYETPGFESFICTIDNTYVDEGRAEHRRQNRLQQAQTRAVRDADLRIPPHR